MEQQKNHDGAPANAKRRSFPFLSGRRTYLWVMALFTLAGVGGGYAYYALAGCNTGSCAITSNPYVSMAWGGALGYLLPDFFVKRQKEQGD